MKPPFEDRLVPGETTAEDPWPELIDRMDGVSIPPTESERVGDRLREAFCWLMAGETPGDIAKRAAALALATAPNRYAVGPVARKVGCEPEALAALAGEAKGLLL